MLPGIFERGRKDEVDKFLKAQSGKEIYHWSNVVFTIRLSIFLTLARACDKRFSADHDTMLSLLIKVFGPWAFTFYQTGFCRIFRREVAKTFSHSSFSDY